MGAAVTGAIARARGLLDAFRGRERGPDVRAEIRRLQGDIVAELDWWRSLPAGGGPDGRDAARMLNYLEVWEAHARYLRERGDPAPAEWSALQHLELRTRGMACDIRKWLASSA